MKTHMMRCPEAPGDPSHGLEVGEVEDLKRSSNQMATVKHMYRNTMGAVCTPTTPPRIPILLRFTVMDGGGDDMHVAIPMHVCAAPFLKWGRCTAIVSARCAPTPGGPVPSPSRREPPPPHDITPMPCGTTTAHDP